MPRGSRAAAVQRAREKAEALAKELAPRAPRPPDPDDPREAFRGLLKRQRACVSDGMADPRSYLSLLPRDMAR